MASKTAKLKGRIKTISEKITELRFITDELDSTTIRELQSAVDKVEEAIKDGRIKLRKHGI